MKRLLTIEFKKLTGNKSFWVFSLLFALFLPAIVLLIPSIIQIELPNGVTYHPAMPRTAEATWYYTTLVSSYFSIFILAFIMIFHISNEYSYRTVRQNIIDGLTRGEFLKGKFILLLFIALCASVYVFLIGLISATYFGSLPPVSNSALEAFYPQGFLENKEDVVFGSIFDGVQFVMAFFIQIIGYFTLATLISFLIRKGALAILLFFAVFVVEKIIGWQLITHKMEKIYDVMPLKNMGDILPNPGFETIINGMEIPVAFSAVNLLFVGGYVLLFVFCTRLLFLKRDIS